MSFRTSVRSDTMPRAVQGPPSAESLTARLRRLEATMESWQLDTSSRRAHTKPASTAPGPQHRHEPDTAELVDSFCSLLAATSATLHSACTSVPEMAAGDPQRQSGPQRQPDVPTQAEPVKVQPCKASASMHDKAVQHSGPNIETVSPNSSSRSTQTSSPHTISVSVMTDGAYPLHVRPMIEHAPPTVLDSLPSTKHLSAVPGTIGVSAHPFPKKPMPAYNPLMFAQPSSQRCFEAGTSSCSSTVLSPSIGEEGWQAVEQKTQTPSSPPCMQTTSEARPEELEAHQPCSMLNTSAVLHQFAQQQERRRRQRLWRWSHASQAENVET